MLCISWLGTIFYPSKTLDQLSKALIMFFIFLPENTIFKFIINFSSSTFFFHVNLLHRHSSLFVYGLLLSLWCFSIFVNYYFLGFFSSKVIISVARITEMQSLGSLTQVFKNQSKCHCIPECLDIYL